MYFIYFIYCLFAPLEYKFHEEKEFSFDEWFFFPSVYDSPQIGYSILLVEYLNIPSQSLNKLLLEGRKDRLKLYVLSIINYGQNYKIHVPPCSLLAEIRHIPMQKVKELYKCMLESSITLMCSLGFCELRSVGDYSATLCPQISLCFTDGWH